MRIFGVPGGSLNQARSTYGFLVPFDLALSAPSNVDPGIAHGGIIFDMTGMFALQYNHVMIGFPDWIFAAPAVEFNSNVDTVIIMGVSTGGAPGIRASVDDQVGNCACFCD